jgi:hypothetical protein
VHTGARGDGPLHDARSRQAEGGDAQGSAEAEGGKAQACGQAEAEAEAEAEACGEEVDAFGTGAKPDCGTDSRTRRPVVPARTCGYGALCAQDIGSSRAIRRAPAGCFIRSGRERSGLSTRARRHGSLHAEGIPVGRHPGVDGHGGYSAAFR